MDKANSFTSFLFALIYRKWLWNDRNENYDRVLHVKGWRTALVAEVTKTGHERNRKGVTPVFWWFD
jgi:hypothetical protein